MTGIHERMAASTCIAISSSSLLGGLAGVQGVLCIVGMVQAAAVMRRTPLASNILHPWLHVVIATIAFILLSLPPPLHLQTPPKISSTAPTAEAGRGGQFKVERAHANAT